MEQDYVELLDKIKVEQEILEIGKIVATRVWEQKIKDVNAMQKMKEAEKKELEQMIDEYLDLIPKSKSESVRTRYEAKIEDLDVRIRELETKNENKKTPDLTEALKFTLKFLGTPAETWVKANKQLKIILHNMIFAENPSYSLNTGFGTPKLTVPFGIKQFVGAQNGDLVEVRGVAPLSER